MHRRPPPELQVVWAGEGGLRAIGAGEGDESDPSLDAQEPKVVYKKGRRAAAAAAGDGDEHPLRLISNEKGSLFLSILSANV
jgi:hypothetical protein